MQFGRLTDLVENRKALNANEALRFAFRLRSLQELVLNLNRWQQLFERGEDSTGTVVGFYSEFTEFIYQGQAFFGRTKDAGDPYFFYDTGSFFDSFYFRRENTYIEIGATDIDKLNDVVEDTDILLGLTDESQETVIEQALPTVRDWLLNQMLG